MDGTPKKRAYTKSRLIKELAFRAGISQRQSRAALEAIIEIAYREAKANYFILPGLCKFDVVRREPRKVRNPITGEQLMLPARDALRVVLSKRAKEAVAPRVAPMTEAAYAAFVAEKTAAEDAARKAAEETARLAAEEATRKVAEEESRKAAEEAARKKAAAEAAKKAQAAKRAKGSKGSNVQGSKGSKGSSTSEAAEPSAKAQEPNSTGNTGGGNWLTAEDRQLSGSFEKNKGRLPVPITGAYMVGNRFGLYTVPGLKNVQLDNKGTNYIGRSGARARSVFDGEVTAVFQFSGTRNVLVRHGSYISVYCNLSSVIVKKGQKVKARDVLGTVAQDEKGNCVLHFQLRKETAKLNPEAWIGK